MAEWKHVAAIITAGGRGVRIGGDVPKQFLELNGKPILQHTLENFRLTGLVDEVVLVVPADSVEQVEQDYQQFGDWLTCVVAGGRERQDSVGNGLDALGPEADIVMVHDGVRPFVSVEMLQQSIEVAHESGGAICAIPVSDTLKRADEDGEVSETVDRQGLWRMQTPQTFSRSLIEEAFDKARADNYYGTDEGMLVERLGRPVKLVNGSEFNIKITRPEDLVLGERIASFWQDHVRQTL